MNDRLKKKILSILVHIKKQPYLYGFLIVLILIFVPILIWLFYMIGTNGWGIPTDYSSGEVLLFYGAILTFLGTISLGGLSLWQNKIFKSSNDTAQNNLNNALDKLANANDIIAKANEKAILTNERMLEITKKQQMQK